MDQCLEYVYILSANFTQRRRSVGGRHKPLPLDDEAHPSHTSSVCDWRCGDTDADRGTLLLHWATELSPPLGPLCWAQPLTLGPYLREEVLSLPNSPSTNEIMKGFISFLTLPR